MNYLSFPKILKFKGKTLPYPQLLRWKDWFSKYDFEVEHIKGEDNLIPDLLSRPSISCAIENPFKKNITYDFHVSIC